jgi:hypothetical protein
MMKSKSPRRSPYQGLTPFSELDAPFFFGREKETRIIIANLFAAPLTLLYGASGVGKSSILRAGVMQQLRQRKDLIAVLFNTWQCEPLSKLLEVIDNSIARAMRKKSPPPSSTSLVDYAKELNRPLMVILDQFEEYFLYHPKGGEFDDELSTAVAQSNVPISFLISIREDTYTKLDRFKGRIPTLFRNFLRVEHLSYQAAHNAITKPIEEYNSRSAQDEHVSIEPELANAVLDQIETGLVTLGETGIGEIKSGKTESRIEAPFLQMVMTRLWDEEMRVGSRTLRVETLNSLSGAKSIVRTQLEDSINLLEPYEKEMASRVFHHLVTPSGTKIAHNLSDLANYASVKTEELAPIMNKLSSEKIRILRPVSSTQEYGEVQYEIFHDVLARPILDWRTKYVQSNEPETKKLEQLVRAQFASASKLIGRLGFKMNRLTLAANISKTNGTSKMSWSWEGVKIVRPGATLSIIPGAIWFSPADCTITSYPKVVSQSFDRPINLMLTEQGKKGCEFQIEIEGALHYGETLDFEYEIKVSKGFFMYREDLESAPQFFKREYWGYNIVMPVEKVEIYITFPKSYSVATFPGVCIGEELSEELMYSEELQRIHRNGWFKSEGSWAKLEIEKPIIGMTYFIYWNPPPKSALKRVMKYSSK